MLFEEDIPEDKGLFTFYREQAEREDEIKREKRLRKKRREEEELEAINQQAMKEEPKPKKIETKKYLLPKQTFKEFPPRQPKSNPTKQRLVESIVDMGKQVDPDQDLTAEHTHINTLRLRQHSHLLKSRRYREKIIEIGQIEGQQTGRHVQVIDQMHIESFHKRNQSEELNSGRLKQAIHSVRGSVELPDIRKPDEVRVPYRPKKSIKSQLIQQALHSRDRDKIKQIRNYLKYQSPFKEQREAGEQQGEIDIDEKSFEVFQFRQQKLLGILKRFRKGI